MPNHISNRLTIEANSERVGEVLAAIAGDKDHPCIDFNRIIPMPEVLKNTGNGSSTIDGQRVTAWWTDNEHGWNDPERKPDRLLTEVEQQEIANTGFTDWYEWSRINWGTKWNAYHQGQKSDNAISFQTAWAAPLPVMNVLAARFPEARFTLEYADEDQGSNAGILVFEHGELAAETSLGYRRACALWFELNECDPLDYGYDPVTFAYTEEDEAA